MMRVGVALMVAALFAGEAQAADQFDLVCKGEFKGSALEKTGQPTHQRFRIDLPMKQWCAEDCTSVQPIAEVTPTRINLEINKDVTDRSSKEQWIDRVNGEWGMLYTRPGPSPTYWVIKGICEIAQFSGINPQTKF